jgi:hypothetical protein
VAERRIQKETGAGEAQPPPMTPEEFRATMELAHFTDVMRKLLKVSKVELDKRVRHAKETSQRAGNLNSPGRKPVSHNNG